MELNERTYYTPEEVGQMLQVSKKTISRAIETGQLKAAKIANMWRIKGEAITDYFDSRTPYKKKKAGALTPAN